MTRLSLILGGLGIQSLLAYTLLPEGRGAYAVCVMFGALFGAYLRRAPTAGSNTT